VAGPASAVVKNHLQTEKAVPKQGLDAERRFELAGRVPGPANVGAGPTQDLITTAAAGFAFKQTLTKTITFRTVATTIDFVANYVVVDERVTAVMRSAFGFVIGPFVYLDHEMVWDYYGPPAHDRQ
jgi:uncharacterized membrane protein